MPEAITYHQLRKAVDKLRALKPQVPEYVWYQGECLSIAEFIKRLNA